MIKVVVEMTVGEDGDIPPRVEVSVNGELIEVVSVEDLESMTAGEFLAKYIEPDDYEDVVNMSADIGDLDPEAIADIFDQDGMSTQATESIGESLFTGVVGAGWEDDDA